jgi:hypothetical protein
LVTLATSITAVLKSPRSLLLLAPDGVGALEGVPVDSGPAPFAQAQGADPDTPATGLTYSLLEARGTSGTPYPELFSIDPTTGAITRIGAALPSGETEISFKVRVSDGITTPLERSFRVGVLSDLHRAPLVVAGSEQRSLAAVAEGSANPAGATVAALSLDDAVSDVVARAQSGERLKEAAQAVAEMTGIPSRDLYNAALAKSRDA